MTERIHLLSLGQQAKCHAKRMRCRICHSAHNRAIRSTPGSATQGETTRNTARTSRRTSASILPSYEDMSLGGVVGQARVIDCVQQHPSHWKIMGSWGMVLAEQMPLTFTPFRGQLGWFDVPLELVAANQVLS